MIREDQHVARGKVAVHAAVLGEGRHAAADLRAHGTRIVGT